MSINDKLKKLKDQERRLELDKKKVEFLQHILESAQTYDHKDFSEVKDEVVKLLEVFVTSAISSVVDGVVPPAPVQPAFAPETPTGATPAQRPAAPQQPKKPDPTGLSPSDKLDFALANRHMSNKRVSVANDQGMTIYGTVVGLDAPFFVVKTEAGPTINVPAGKVSPV